MKKIKFIIFNEDYWSKGLIYSQHILPLINFHENNKEYSIEIISYISFLDLILYKKQINTLKNDLANSNIKIVNLPTLFLRARVFSLKWYLFPFLIITTMPYLFWHSISDLANRNKLIIYHLRSYPSAFLYSSIYFGRSKLIFDPRSDFIQENIRIGLWGKNSITNRLWEKIENMILNKTHKSVFISSPLRSDILERNNINFNNDKHILFYNTVDFKNFKIAFSQKRDSSKIHFLYTGGLGNWNNIETYLFFFQKVKKYIPDALFTIVTKTREVKYINILHQKKFKDLIPSLNIYNNIPYNELPFLYKKCTFGLQLMNETDSRVGVKFVEYLAAGLIPIVNNNVRGAAQICKEKNLGIVIKNVNDLNFEEFCKNISSLKNANEFITQIDNNKSLFDVNNSYKKLNLIYEF